MNEIDFVAMRIERQTRLWNMTISKHATRFEFHPTHVRFLHATKGWRTIANRRLGL